MISLDKDNVTPLYVQLADIMKNEINVGSWRKGEKIPTEKELSEKFRVSRVTIRKALENLEKESLLIRQQGKGTYVNNEKIQRSISGVQSFSSIYEALGSKPGAKVIKQIIEQPSEEDITELNLEKDEKVVVIERIRYVDDIPVAIEISHFPETRFNFLLKENLNDTSMFEIIKNNNIFFYNEHKVIELIFSNFDTSYYLGIDENYPLILISGVSEDQSGAPSHLWRQYIVGDKFKFVI